MKYYRRFKAIKAISFDLDDTLYSNRSVMLATERAMIEFFADNLPSELSAKYVFDRSFWHPFRKQVIKQSPELIHDVSAIRFACYRLGIASLGVNEADSQEITQRAMHHFMTERCKVNVPEQSHQLLKKLSAHLPVVAISNGNVDTKAIGIEHHFRYIFHAGDRAGNRILRSKPHPDMFHQACQQLSITPQELLHVGDCGQADIKGAINAGCQSAWLPHYNVGKPLSVLPDIELSDVGELLSLLQ